MSHYFEGWKCDTCGRFVSPWALGVSGSQRWSETWDGPDLHEPVYRCSACTDKHGIRGTNCYNPERYQWRNPALSQLAEARGENAKLREQIEDDRERAGDDDTFL